MMMLILLINKKLPRSIWTEANTVESSAQLCLIFWMTLQITQFMHAMSKLTFITIFAFSRFLKRTTKFRFVAACVIKQKNIYIVNVLNNGMWWWKKCAKLTEMCLSAELAPIVYVPIYGDHHHSHCYCYCHHLQQLLLRSLHHSRCRWAM